ncbi:MAG: phosphatase domain-containing protein [Candidatus Kariarchaeaceae archaeon]
MSNLAEHMRFSWIDQNVAGFSEPNYSRKIEFLLSQGIRKIVTLTKRALPENWVREYSLVNIHIPMHENGLPSKEQLEKYLSFVCQEVKKGNKVGVHCQYGVSRTGMMLALYLIKCKGLNSKEAISQIRSKRPLSLQSISQLKYLQKISNDL